MCSVGLLVWANQVLDTELKVNLDSSQFPCYLCPHTVFDCSPALLALQMFKLSEIIQNFDCWYDAVFILG